MSSLFEAAGLEQPTSRPLADRLRPTVLGEVVGQEGVLGPEGPLARMLGERRLASLCGVDLRAQLGLVVVHGEHGVEVRVQRLDHHLGLGRRLGDLALRLCGAHVCVCALSVSVSVSFSVRVSVGSPLLFLRNSCGPKHAGTVSLWRPAPPIRFGFMWRGRISRLVFVARPPSSEHAVPNMG